MIHQLLNITRSLFTLDCETTGLNRDTARIIELGFQHWTPNGLHTEWRSLIDPTIPIPPAISELTSITDEMIKTLCRRCSRLLTDHPLKDCMEGLPIVSFKHYAPKFATGFSNCDFAGKNIRYDLQILSKEMERYGVTWDYAGARIIDADRLEAIARPRDLSTMYESYTGEKLEGAHGALSDVRASTVVIVKQLEGFEVLPRDLDALHQASWPGWLDSEGKIRMVDGVATVMFGKHKYTPMKDVPRDYWDWMLGPKQKFAADVIALVRDAKLGKFPS